MLCNHSLALPLSHLFSQIISPNIEIILLLFFIPFFPKKHIISGALNAESLTPLSNCFIEERKESITSAKTESLCLASHQCKASKAISIMIIYTP